MSISKVGRISIGLALIGFGVGCAPVRLIEENDPRIEQGMTDYQQALEVFVNQTLANYEMCQVHSEELQLIEEMRCTDGSTEVRQLCDEALIAEKMQSSALMEESCGAASYTESRRVFYIEQEARLSVLKTRASVLDSMGICVRAINGVNKAIAGAVPSEIRDAIDTEATQSANNCTEIVVNTVLENHKAMNVNHRCIEDPELANCPDQYKNIDVANWDSAVQAGFYFPIQLETLLQNIRIVLFLEEAKKRGESSE